ncbi:hypothetical protein NQ314_015646 [Rhamnusium bicolor]|uniref:DDE Tnp4 domain-containing protein n=1 Tax=Rhamnusium bicolor TaxID=1586634 RepID=A0AAV8WZ83_9CUCU|nr:hypothetical protein NQ314_015646 [Rhamnusium bicolor]
MQNRYNTNHRRVRSLIEQCSGILKMRFRCLLNHCTLHYSPTRASKIVNACVVLHKIYRFYNLTDILEED